MAEEAQQAVYVVEIVDTRTDQVVDAVGKEDGGISLRQAEKMERGININLNHEHYFTRLEEMGE